MSKNTSSQNPQHTNEEADYYTSRGHDRGDAGDFKGAVRQYRKAANLEPEDSQHWTHLGDAYAAADKPQQAIRSYQKALDAGRTQNGKLPAQIVEAHLGLGDLCRTFAMSATAVRSYERAVRSRPKKPFYRWKLATALITLGMYEKARAQMEKVIEMAPDDAFYRFTLADIYLLMLRDKDAIKELKKVVKLARRDEYYHLRLGAALLRDSRPAEALPYFERAVELKGDNESYRILLNYARQRNVKGEEHHAGIAAQIESIELHPYDADFVRRFQLLSQPIPK